MKILKDWRLILLLTIVLCLTPFFTDLYEQYNEQPNEGWSDSIELVQLTDVDFFNQDLYSVYNDEESVYIGYILDKTLNLERFDLLGHSMAQWTLDFVEGNKPSKVEMANVDGVNEIHILIDDMLIKYNFDLDAGFTDREVIARGVLDYELVSDELVYTTEQSLYTSFGFTKENEDGFDRYDLLKIDNDIYFAYVTLKSSERVLNYVEVIDGITSEREIEILPFNTVGDLEVYEDDGINVVVPNRLIPRNKESYEMHFYSDLTGDYRVETKLFPTLKSFKVSIDKRPSGDFIMLIPQKLHMGQKYGAVNFWTTDIHDHTLRVDQAMTKTTDYTKYYDYFSVGDGEYIVFADSQLARKTISLSGSTDALIAQGHVMHKEDYGALLRDGLMSLILLPTMILVFYSFTAITSLAFFGIAMFAPGDIIVNKPKVSRNIGLMIHSLVFVYYIVSMFINNTANPLVYSVMPEYLQNTGVIFAITFITMALAFLIIELFNRQKFEPSGIVVKHFLFITMHTALFALVFYSHYAGYSILRYFLFN